MGASVENTGDTGDIDVSVDEKLPTGSSGTELWWKAPVWRWDVCVESLPVAFFRFLLVGYWQFVNRAEHL
jgi:hypothetical protein